MCFASFFKPKGAKVLMTGFLSFVLALGFNRALHVPIDWTYCWRITHLDSTILTGQGPGDYYWPPDGETIPTLQSFPTLYPLPLGMHCGEYVELWIGVIAVSYLISCTILEASIKPRREKAAR
jgi:hypothetical protein